MSVGQGRDPGRLGPEGVPCGSVHVLYVPLKEDTQGGVVSCTFSKGSGPESHHERGVPEALKHTRVGRCAGRYWGHLWVPVGGKGLAEDICKREMPHYVGASSKEIPH